MRLIPVLTVAACLCAPGALFAQEWTVQRPGVTVTHLMWNFMDMVSQAIYLYGAPPPPVNSRGGQGGFGRINAPGAPAAQDGAASPQSGQPR